MVIAGQPHLQGEASHDVLDQCLVEGSAVEVFFVVELMHDVQVGLESLDLGGEVFSHFLDGIILREEVKRLPKMSMLPNSSMNLTLKMSQSVMLLKGLCLASKMACMVSATFTTFSALVRVNLFRTADNQG